VDGTKIPDVSWDAGASYAGLLPISNKTGENRKLYFWFFPPGPQGSTDDLVMYAPSPLPFFYSLIRARSWLNGGPGCSSLEGLLQENGPISWQFGQAAPTQNPYSWTNLSSVLWIDSPLGTGWSAGAPAAANEHDVSAQLVGFLQQFLGVFSEMKGKNLYLTGESVRPLPHLLRRC
jgi:carboxypeptidase D